MSERTHTFYRDDFSVYGSPGIEGNNPGWIVSVSDRKVLNCRFWVSGKNFHEIEDHDYGPKEVIHETIIGKVFDDLPESVMAVVHDAICQWEKEIEGLRS